MKDGSYLRGHRYFRNLKPAEGEELASLFSVLECRSGACLIPEGSPVEGIYLIREGAVKESDRIYGAGEILGTGSVLAPYASPFRADVLEGGRILYLSRSDLLLWANRRPRAWLRLDPALRAGISGKRGPLLSASVLRENRLFWLLKTLPTLLFPPLLLVRLLLRRRNGTFVEGDRLTCRYFRWKNLKNTNLTIPLEQIQSVEIQQKGLVSRLLRTGNLLIRVNGAEGHVLVRNIPRPQEEQERILSLKRRAEEAAAAAKHRRIRRDIAQWIRREEGIVLVEEGAESRADRGGEAVFRKSLWILLSLTWWQIALMGGGIYLILQAKRSGEEWLILLLIALGLILALLLYRVVDWANDLYKVAGGYLLDVNRKPLGKEKCRRQAELGVIQNVIAEQKGIWANLLDFGNIRIIIPGSGEGILWEGLRNPERVQNLILRERRSWLDSLGEKERLEQQEDLMLYCRILSQELSGNNRF